MKYTLTWMISSLFGKIKKSKIYRQSKKIIRKKCGYSNRSYDFLKWPAMSQSNLNSNLKTRFWHTLWNILLSVMYQKSLKSSTRKVSINVLEVKSCCKEPNLPHIFTKKSQILSKTAFLPSNIWKWSCHGFQDIFPRL